MVRATAPLVLFGLLSCGRQRHPDLLLITLDTTRADALGSYGAVPSPTPFLDDLAGRGIRVEEAMTTAPLTLPAHAGLLTGLYPDRTGVRDNMSARLAEEQVTLAEVLRDHGYRTGAFVAAAVLDEAFGLAQGFERYDDRVTGDALTLGIPQRPAGAVVDVAATWLDEVAPGGDPVFAWVHVYDAHRPYEPAHATGSLDPYASELAYIDGQLRRLVDGWRRHRREPLVVVVSDHGEGRGDHGEATHGWFAYRSTMRVPLLMAGPGLDGRVLPGPVSTTDVMPTILELLYLPSPSDVDGRSFAGEARGGPASPREPVFGETWTPRLGYGFSEIRVAQGDRYRFIHAPVPELYDWVADPGEEQPLGGAPWSVDGADLEAKLDAFVQRAASAPTGGMVDPSVIPALEALGYVAGAPEPAGGDLPDPKTRPDMVELYDHVMISARTRPPAEAVDLLDGFLEEFPGVTPARLLLARACLFAGRYEHGLEALAPVLEGNAQARLLEAQLLLASGRTEEGRRALEAVEAEWPSWAAPYAVLAAHLQEAGDCAGAVVVAGKGLTRAEDDVSLLVVRGACRGGEGEDDLRRALALDPSNVDVRFFLGTLLARAGRPDEAVLLLEAQVALTPDRAQAAAALGLAYYELGRSGEALRLLNRVAEAPDAGAEAPLVLADLLLAEGRDLERALAFLDLAEARRPGDAQAHAVRARVLSAMGRAREATEEAERYRAALGQVPPAAGER